MKSYIKYFVFFASILATTITTAQESKISRRDLCNLKLNKQIISKVEMQEVTIGEGISAPKHYHPCPVIGIIQSGSILFQIEGEEKIILKAGDSFYEPKKKTILHFDNASEKEPATFVAIYLKKRNETNIKIINP